MTSSKTLDTQKAVQAARQIAPVANWVKPSSKDITLPTPMRPTYSRISELEKQLEAERSEKFMLEKSLAYANRQIHALRERLSAFIKDERS